MTAKGKHADLKLVPRAAGAVPEPIQTSSGSGSRSHAHCGSQFGPAGVYLPGINIKSQKRVSPQAGGQQGEEGEDAPAPAGPDRRQQGATTRISTGLTSVLHINTQHTGLQQGHVTRR